MVAVMVLMAVVMVMMTVGGDPHSIASPLHRFSPFSLKNDVFYNVFGRFR